MRKLKAVTVHGTFDPGAKWDDADSPMVKGVTQRLAAEPWHGGRATGDQQRRDDHSLEREPAPRDHARRQARRQPFGDRVHGGRGKHGGDHQDHAALENRVGLARRPA